MEKSPLSLNFDSIAPKTIQSMRLEGGLIQLALLY